MAADLDLRTILEASQEIAGELELNLLAKLLAIVMENAGAQRGYLIREWDGQWMVIAQAEMDEATPAVARSVRVEAMDTVSASIVHYVAHTKELVVLADAANEERFVDDTTIQKRRPKSILCMPFINQGKVSAILYLENNLATGAFTSARVELLNLLSSQMVLGLDNAQLYANLAKSEAKYRGLVDNSLVGVYTSTLDGRFTFVNNAMARVFEFDSTELMIARGTLERWKDPKDRERMLAELQEHGRVTNFEAETITRKGRNINVLFSAKLEGDTISGMVMDITARKQADEALRQSRDFLEHLTCAVPDAIFSIKMPERIINWANDSFNVMGYEPEEYIGKTTKKYYANPEDYDAVGHLQEDAIRRGDDMIRTEVMVLRKDGRVIPVELTATYYREEGKISLITALVRDISERKLAEQKILDYQQRLKALASRLTITEEMERRAIAVALHDHVGQSLALARMQLALARKSTSDSKLADKLDDISDTLSESLEDTQKLMLELSSPTMHGHSFSSAISEWLEVQIESRHGLKTEFIANIPDNCRKTLGANVRTILFRNVRELVVNVVKHARANKVRVRLEDRSPSIRIIVEDDGIGFDPSEVTQKGSKTGGFGLFSIEELMSDLGGSLRIVSEPGKGCTAILSVPFGESDSQKRE